MKRALAKKAKKDHIIIMSVVVVVVVAVVEFAFVLNHAQIRMRATCIGLSGCH